MPNISGDYYNGTNTINMNLPVILFQEDDIHFAFIPSLDLTGYGNSLEDSLTSLGTVLDEFLRYTCSKHTLMTELKRLGWTVKKEKSMIAPEIADLITSNDQLKDIVNNKHYSTSDYSVQLPAFA